MKRRWRCCAIAAPSFRPTGSLLVIEFVLPDVVPGPAPELVFRFMSDLNMMAVTGGRERSEREWRQLLEEAGFTLARNIPVPELDVSILEAHPLTCGGIDRTKAEAPRDSPRRSCHDASRASYSCQRLKISEPFVPPKPKEFDSAYSVSIFCGLFGT